ncbi:HEXXH motif domain-containing protein [Streptosporangiaceae bacterium NEAU-GS5]|nr:HEXXH motif domain-containing protein [Streptosporangiaceae bacterium NEAU-GS5]
MSRPPAVPGDVFAELAAGAGGKRAMRMFAAAERARRLVLLRSVVVFAQRKSHERAWELTEAYDLLADLHEDHEDAVERVLGYPTVGTWVTRMLKALTSKHGGGPQVLAYLQSLAVAAAIVAGVDQELELTVAGGRVVLPSLGTARLATAPRRDFTRVTVRTGPSGGELYGTGSVTFIPQNPDHYAEGWTGVRKLLSQYRSRTLEVFLDDVDPYRIPEGWPVRRQRPATAQRWQEVLDEAWELMIDHHPAYAEEVESGLTMIVPLHPPHGRTVSSTSRHAFGAFAGSLPKDGRILASLFAHELQHAKLWALIDLVPLTEKPAKAEPLLYAAWRDDPRPPSALLNGAYAHLAVASFWRTQRFLDDGQAAQRAHTEYARWRRHTSDAIQTLLDSGHLTPAGIDFVTGMADTVGQWRSDSIPAAADLQARVASARHYRAWMLRNER